MVYALRGWKILILTHDPRISGRNVCVKQKLQGSRWLRHHLFRTQLVSFRVSCWPCKSGFKVPRFMNGGLDPGRGAGDRTCLCRRSTNEDMPPPSTNLPVFGAGLLAVSARNVTIVRTYVTAYNFQRHAEEDRDIARVDLRHLLVQFT